MRRCMLRPGSGGNFPASGGNFQLPRQQRPGLVPARPRSLATHRLTVRVASLASGARDAPDADELSIARAMVTLPPPRRHARPHPGREEQRQHHDDPEQHRNLPSRSSTCKTRPCPEAPGLPRAGIDRRVVVRCTWVLGVCGCLLRLVPFVEAASRGASVGVGTSASEGGAGEVVPV